MSRRWLPKNILDRQTVVRDDFLQVRETGMKGMIIAKARQAAEVFFADRRYLFNDDRFER